MDRRRQDTPVDGDVCGVDVAGCVWDVVEGLHRVKTPKVD